MKFRNYVPHDKNLQEGKLAPAVLPKFEDPVSAPQPDPQPQEVSYYPIYLNSLIFFLLFLTFSHSELAFFIC